MLLLETQAHAIQSRRNNQESISRTKNPPKSLIDGQGPGRARGFSKTVVSVTDGTADSLPQGRGMWLLAAHTKRLETTIDRVQMIY